jgi:dihydroorotate dehydrogenase (fumarate)
MADLSTQYLGLKLKNPIIAASSGLTGSVEKIKKLVEAGVGAVVLKSLFEEQIIQNVQSVLSKANHVSYPEANDYVTEYVRQNDINAYLELIKACKSNFDIPIIASINCYSAEGWVDFARQAQQAGADAIEINIHFLNLDKNTRAEDIETLYYSVLQNVREQVEIPIVMKLGNQFANLIAFVNNLKVIGAEGVVLFNRFFEPDIDIHTLNIVAADVFSTPADIWHSLRWVALVSAKVQDINISASTGIHSGEAVIKQLLAGAQTVQICSAIYKNGVGVVNEMLDNLEQWMIEHQYNTINDFRGMLNYSQIEHPQMFERSQFMRYYSNYE